jgi:hypothetical protein
MNEPLPYRGPTPPDPNRQSGWGIASFVCSCLVAGSLAAAAAVHAISGASVPRDGEGGLSPGLLGLIGAWALAVVLGVVSLLQYERRQLFAAWGLILAAITGPLLLITAGLAWGRFN